MNSNPLVSTIIIFLNEERFIREAIESVLAQTYDNWELLLVDDGSTDGSTQIALQYAEQYPEKVRYLEHPWHQNRGMSAARNLGISHARGEYLSFLDADDVWLSHKLEQQVELLTSYPEAGMVYGATQYWYSWTGNPEDVQRNFVVDLGVQTNTLFKPPTLLTLLFPLGVAPTPSTSNLLFRREVVERTGAFEEDFKDIFEDQTFMVKVNLKEPVFVASECWDRYRQHPGSCYAAMERTGNYTGYYYSVRLFFLDWLGEYLSQQGVKDPEVWRLFRQRQRITQLRVYIQKREWRPAMRSMLTTLRHHPREIFFRTFHYLRRRVHVARGSGQ